jgi:serine O-acetyltransferase
MGNEAVRQLNYLRYELGLIVNKRWWRWLTCWFGGGAGVIVSYRLDRCLYLVFGKSWSIVRLAFFPVFLFLRLISAKHEIHFRADVGRGLLILHPSLGVVISAYAVVGDHLTLTGGNCIGGRKGLKHGNLVLGNRVSLGANAVILGPVRIGDRTDIGAGAVVVHDFPGHGVLAGVPAKAIRLNDQEEIA